MQLLIITLLTFSAPMANAEGAAEADALIDAMVPAAPADLVLRQSPRRRGQRPPAQKPRQPKKARKRRPKPPPKKPALELFWRLFPPPGPYTTEVGVSVGASYLETSFGGINPNIMYRAHFAMRPMPRRLPIVIYGMADYSNYEQSAGPLVYSSRFFTLGAGAGLNYWVGPLRFDLMGEAGVLTRVSTQTDGFIEPIRNVNTQPVIGAIAGGALALGGRVALSLRGGVRTYDIATQNRVDFSVLYGVEWMIDARPVKYY